METQNDTTSLNNSSTNNEFITTINNNCIESNNVSEDNNCHIVSESSKKVYLPYSKKEILDYLEKYPEQYNSFSDVVNQEFICPLDLYIKHPVFSRFKEAYYLIRDREAKPVLDAIKIALDVMFNYDLNPAIIAACKSQAQLENYLMCLKNKNLNSFKDFEIRFEVAPLNLST